MADEKEKRQPQDTSLEMRVAALEDKLGRFKLSEDELETFRKVMKVGNALRMRSAVRRMSAACIEERADGCISGCISPCDCSDCGCIEGCIEERADGCISGCISPCDCSDCGCVEGCIEEARPTARRRFTRTFRRFGSFGR